MGLINTGKKTYPYNILKSVTLVANNGTASLSIATVTGSVRATIYGVVTTNLSSNITAAHIRMNDGTNTPDITLAAGTTLSSYTAGSVISKTGQVDVALTATLNDQTRILESAVDNLSLLQEFMILKKTAATSTIEFRYTCNNQSSGVIQFFIDYAPMSADGLVTAA